MSVSWKHIMISGILGTGLCLNPSFSAAVQAAPVNMQVVEGDVRSVLMTLARAGHENIVLDDSVGGTVTLHVTEEPQNLLRMVAASKGLVLVKEGTTYLVTAAAKVDGLRSVHVYSVHYAEPQDIARAAELSLRENGASEQTGTAGREDAKKSAAAKGESTVETSGRRVLVNNATNSVLFYGTAAEAASVEQVVRQLDRQPRQVSLEAKVVALSKDASKKLGVEWEWSSLPQYPDYETTYRHKGSSNEVEEKEVKRHTKDGMMPGIIQFGRGPEGIPFEFYYGATIQALVTQGKAKMLARPNITTVQGREAVINIGGEVPVPTQSVTDNTMTTTYTYRQAGIILRCTPRLHDDGRITAAVHTEVSSPLYVEDIKAYRFQNRSADTTVSLRDGETMVIGGLIGSDESRTLSKIPFLGDLPILGSFFRSVRKSHSESEVMIFLTAHIIPEQGKV